MLLSWIWVFKDLKVLESLLRCTTQTTVTSTTEWLLLHSNTYNPNSHITFTMLNISFGYKDDVFVQFNVVLVYKPNQFSIQKALSLRTKDIYFFLDFHLFELLLYLYPGCIACGGPQFFPDDIICCSRATARLSRVVCAAGG